MFGAMVLVSAAAWANEAETRLIPMPKTPLPKGAIIQPEMLAATAHPASQVFAGTLTDAAQAIGLQTTRPLLAGRPINRLHLKPVPLIAQGSTVPFIFARGPIRLSGSGQALEDGLAGQSIRLLNPATRATLVGTVQPDGLIVVN